MKWWLILLSVIGAGALTGAGSGQLKPAPPAILARPPLNIGLSVADAEKTARWYEETLGLVRRKTSNFPKGKAIILGSSSVEVEIIQHEDATDARKRLNIREDYLAQGIFKFGFYVDNLDATITRLKQRNVKFYYEHGTDEELGLRFAIIADEDGNTIQLFQPIASDTLPNTGHGPRH